MGLLAGEFQVADKSIFGREILTKLRLIGCGSVVMLKEIKTRFYVLIVKELLKN